MKYFILKVKGSNQYFGSPMMKYAEGHNLLVPNYTVNPNLAGCIKATELERTIGELPIAEKNVVCIDSDTL